jgi:hypothetical protein
VENAKHLQKLLDQAQAHPSIGAAGILAERLRTIIRRSSAAKSAPWPETRWLRSTIALAPAGGQGLAGVDPATCLSAVPLRLLPRFALGLLSAFVPGIRNLKQCIQAANDNTPPLDTSTTTTASSTP